MEEAIKKFVEQFNFEPEIKNQQNLKSSYGKFVVGGMGGSHLAAGILQMIKPNLDLHIHQDYGLPVFNKENNRLYIASSYSGNTEETLDFAENARKEGLDVAAIATGGNLIMWAEKFGIPHIIIPDTGIQPRMALGFSIKALAKLMDLEDVSQELSNLASTIDPEEQREEGKKLALDLSEKIPVIYSSRANTSIAYNWKIKFNETGKIPAFYNVFPELNHNEMTGFDSIDSTEDLSSKFHFIIVRDTNDDWRVVKRMEICEELLEEAGLPVTSISLTGANLLERIFNSLILADWTAYYIAKANGAEAEQVPMVEKFKKLLMETE